MRYTPPTPEEYRQRSIDWERKKAEYKRRAEHSVHYDFRLRNGIYQDINNPEHYTLDRLCEIAGVKVPPEYVTYCLIHTRRCDLKYRDNGSYITIVITWL